MAAQSICSEMKRKRRGIEPQLRIKLIGTKSNRDGIGATVKLTAGGETQDTDAPQRLELPLASELVLTFGLAHNERAKEIEIRWPVVKLIAGQTGPPVRRDRDGGAAVTTSRSFGKKN